MFVSLAAMIVFFIGASFSSSPASEAMQADIIRGLGCNFFDANGSLYHIPGARLEVHTNNARGNTNVMCQGSLPDGAALPSRAMQFSFDNTGFTCNGSTNWKGQITPSGRFSFTCHLP
jgi:hypothetical protein